MFHGKGPHHSMVLKSHHLGTMNVFTTLAIERLNCLTFCQNNSESCFG